VDYPVSNGCEAVQEPLFAEADNRLSHRIRLVSGGQFQTGGFGLAETQINAPSGLRRFRVRGGDGRRATVFLEFDKVDFEA
jgi:hypothetical protein